MSDVETMQLDRIKAATTAEELAVALYQWAVFASKEGGNTPQWWVEQLWRHVNGRADEATGMTLDELIPETIAEWRSIRGDVQP